MSFKISRFGLLVALTAGFAEVRAESPVQSTNANTQTTRDELPPPTRKSVGFVEPLPTPSEWTSPPKALTLAELEAMAQSRNPTLTQAYARVEAARGRWVQAGLYPNPKLGYEGNELGNNKTAGFQGGFVSQEVVTSHKLQLGRATVSQEVMQAEREFEAQRLRLLNDVRTEYYNALVAQRATELTQEVVRIDQQSFATTESLLKAKEIGRADLLQSRVELNTAKLALEETRNRFVGTWRRMAAVVGSPDMTPTPLDGDPMANIPECSWDDSLRRLLTCSPELAAARAGVERARWNVRREEANKCPNVELRAGVQHDNSSGFNVANLEVGIPLPLFNRNQGNIRQAEAELTAAQANVERLELELHRRLAIAFERYANAHNQVNKYSKDILPDAKGSLDLVTAGYRSGDFGFLPLLTAQRTYYQSNLAQLTALRELWESSIFIESLLLNDSLQNPR